MRARVFLVVVFLDRAARPRRRRMRRGLIRPRSTGPGWPPRSPSTGTEGSDDDLGTLADLAGLWPATYAQQSGSDAHRGADEGPGSEAGDHLEAPGRRAHAQPRSDRSSTCTRRAGPLTYTAPDQPLIGSERTTGGWFRTPSALQPRWETFDLPTRATLEAAARPAAERRGHRRATRGGGRSARGRGSSWSVRRSAPCAVIASRRTSGRRVRVGST